MKAARELAIETAIEAGFDEVPPFGMMIEVPSVLFELEHYTDVADFFSVGTNDLIQYLLAVDRGNEQVKNYYNPYQPAVLRAMAGVVDTLTEVGRPLSVCGEMASHPLSALALMALGFRSFSVHPRAFAAIGALTYTLEDDFLQDLRDDLLRLETDGAVEHALRAALRTVAPFLVRF
jgi:phosphotransferase system enzyme I (PtsP)